MNSLSFYDKSEPLIFDGAFGTYYRKIAPNPLMHCESAVLNDPDSVEYIHREYILAGASAIKTNTFAANQINFPDTTILSKIISAAYHIAKSAAKDKAIVYADIGYITNTDTEASEHYIELAKYFLACGAENFLFETMCDLIPIIPALNYIRTVKNNAKIAVSFAVSQDGYSENGKFYTELISDTEKYADLIGLNCVCGPSHIFQLLSKIDMRRYNILAMPNAGYPARVDGRLEYHDNPEYFAQKLSEIVDMGAVAVGGCCGTTPEHIKLTVQKLKQVCTNQNAERETTHTEPISAPNSISYSRLHNILNSSHKTLICAVELDPPADTDSTFLINSASMLAAAGADVITLADSPLARVRADSIMLSAKVKRECGIDVMPHLSCRDRNRIALKGALIAANIEGIQNILSVTGDSAVTGGKRAEEDSNVFNLNSIRFIEFISALNSEIFSAAPFTIAAALNVNAPNFAAELRRAHKKAESGAQILFTQAIFSDESAENLISARKELSGVQIFAGILPLAGYKNALFLNNEVAGITVPDEVISSLCGKTRDEATEISLNYAKSIIDRAVSYCDGIYLMTPLKRIDLTMALVNHIKHIERTSL